MFCDVFIYCCKLKRERCICVGRVASTYTHLIGNSFCPPTKTNGHAQSIRNVFEHNHNNVRIFMRKHFYTILALINQKLTRKFFEMFLI